MELHQNQLSIEFELPLKDHSWNRSLVDFSMMELNIISSN